MDITTGVLIGTNVLTAGVAAAYARSKIRMRRELSNVNNMSWKFSTQLEAAQETIKALQKTPSQPMSIEMVEKITKEHNRSNAVVISRCRDLEEDNKKLNEKNAGLLKQIQEREEQIKQLKREAINAPYKALYRMRELASIWYTGKTTRDILERFFNKVSNLLTTEANGDNVHSEGSGPERTIGV